LNADDERLLQLAELAEAGLAAASLVHELRQPLFALKATLQLGQQAGGLDPARLADLLTSVEHLEGLLDAWGGVGREESPALYDAGEVVGEVVRMLRPRARSVGVDVELRLDPRVWAHGAPSVARQVTTNLLQNALDAVAGQEARQVVVGVYAQGGQVVIEVADSGPGLDPSVRDRVFEPFVTTKARGGTGLGLYVARRLCETAGGSIELASSAAGTVARAQFKGSSDEGRAVAGPMKKA
jgi:two-component system C4-dicarboxylate transport sensor histidine kinase DctB